MIIKFKQLAILSLLTFPFYVWGCNAPPNEIVYVNGFEKFVLEDAEDGSTNGWGFYGTTAGSTVTNVADNGGCAIELHGNNGTDNGFSFTGLNITSGFVVSWDLKYSEDFRFFVQLHTVNSPASLVFMEYTPDDLNNGLSGSFIHHGLGSNANDGTWHSFTRDIVADFNATSPNDTITEIVGFSIRGSGRIDNISTSSRVDTNSFSFDGHDYEIIKTPMSWQTASNSAIATGCYLANIGSIAENHEIYSRLFRHIAQIEYANTIASNGGGASYVWIGGNDITTEDAWVWQNNSQQFWQGEQWGTPENGLYSNWGRNTNLIQFEPDDTSSQDAAGIALTRWPISNGNLGQTSQWNDLIAIDLLYSIVECEL